MNMVKKRIQCKIGIKHFWIIRAGKPGVHCAFCKKIKQTTQRSKNNG